MTLQFGTSLTYYTSSINYDRNMFIIQATVDMIRSGLLIIFFLKLTETIQLSLGSVDVNILPEVPIMPI